MITKILGKGAHAVLTLALMLAGTFALGQNANTGEIKGTVTDVTGAVVPDVKVTITNVQTGANSATATNADGIYDQPSLPVGQYRITFAKDGFRQFVRDGINLQMQTIAIDATMQVGAPTEQIVVTAEAPLLQTETSDQQTNFNTQQVLNAPITGGIWYSELTKVLPGVGGGGGRNASGGEGVAVNGTQSYTANFQIEGSSATDPRDLNASDNYVPIDAIGEVSVNAAGGAQTGNSLLSLNVNLKSGTNSWHGSLFEFVQNDVFNSRNYFQNSGKKAVERWNEFGGSVGGPIVKDKLFFYFTYQRNPVQSGGFYTTTVPTAAMRNGDFSGVDGLGNPLFPTIYDSTSCSGSCARTALNGGSNIINSGQMDPVALKVLSYIPKPTDANPLDLTNNYSAVVSTASLGQWYVGKIDYNISANHRLSGSIFEYPITLTFNPDALCGLGFDCTTSTPNNRNQSARITETWTVSPTMVNEFRLGGMREHDQYAGGTFGKGFLSKLGMQPQYGSNAPADVFPNFTVSPNTALGVSQQTFIGGGIHANLVEDIYTASDVLTLIRGKHSIKIGGEFDRQFQHDTTWGDASSGNFGFTGVGTNSGTSVDPRTGATSGGVPFADFLLGQVGNWYIYNGDPTNIATWIGGAFAQDDFKVTPRLTINVGLRYQRQTGWAVADGRFANFNPALANPGVPDSWYPSNPNCQTGTNCLGALQYGKINGHNTIEPSANSWSPRIGFAWSPYNTWSLRGSYGIFQIPRGSELYAHDNFPATLGFGFNPHGSIYPSTNDPAFPLQTGPAPGSVIFPTAANLTADQFNYQQVGFYPSSVPLQYVQQFLVSVQHELPARNLVDVSYVHTKGTHLNFATDMNQVPAADLATMSGGGDYSSFRPFPYFRSILAHDFTGWSNYDALQLRVAKQFSSGLSYQFNYSWAKMLDTGTSSGHDQGLDYWQIANDPRANYGISQLDAPHNFNGSVSYELPFGNGRKFPLKGVLDQVAGGWRVTSIIQARSGAPFTPVVADGSINSGDLAFAGSTNCFCGYALYPNRIGSGAVSNPSLSNWFNVADFTDPTNGGTTPAFGNSGRNILRGPRFVNMDLGIGKTFRIREGIHLEFRADSYNFLNHPQFNNPDNNILSSTAGQITSAQGANNFGPGRIFQLGARLSF